MVDNYIADLDKTNPKLSQLIANMWKDIQANAASYQGQSVAQKLDDIIDQTIQDKVHEKASYWHVNEDELQFVVDNYRQGKDKQIGEKAITDSQDYQAYKDARGDQALNKLKYKKALKEDYLSMIAEDILPLKGGR